MSRKNSDEEVEITFNSNQQISSSQSSITPPFMSPVASLILSPAASPHASPCPSIRSIQISHQLRNYMYEPTTDFYSKKKTLSFCSHCTLCKCNCHSTRQIALQTEVIGTKLQKHYEDFFDVFEFPTLPIVESDTVTVQTSNYLACKVWMLCYADIEINGRSIKKLTKKQPTADSILTTVLWEECLVTAEDVGSLLIRFHEDLLKIKVKFDKTKFCTKIDTDAEQPSKFEAIPKEEVSNALILQGNTTGFTNLRSGIHNSLSNKWTLLAKTADKQKLLDVGLNEVITDFRRIHSALNKSNRILSAATKRFIFHRRTLQPTLRWLKKYHTKVELQNELPKGEETDLYLKAHQHFEFMISKGEDIYKKICEAVLVSRLCYITMRGGIGEVDENPRTYQSALSQQFNRTFMKLLKWENFTSTDFYQTHHPHILLKIPVYLSNAVELGIFLDEHDKRKSILSSESMVPTLDSFDLKTNFPELANRLNTLKNKASISATLLSPHHHHHHHHTDGQHRNPKHKHAKKDKK